MKKIFHQVRQIAFSSWPRRGSAWEPADKERNERRRKKRVKKRGKERTRKQVGRLALGHAHWVGQSPPLVFLVSTTTTIALPTCLYLFLPTLSLLIIPCLLKRFLLITHNLPLALPKFISPCCKSVRSCRQLFSSTQLCSDFDFIFVEIWPFEKFRLWFHLCWKVAFREIVCEFQEICTGEFFLHFLFQDCRFKRWNCLRVLERLITTGCFRLKFVSLLQGIWEAWPGLHASQRGQERRPWWEWRLAFYILTTTTPLQNLERYWNLLYACLWFLYFVKSSEQILSSWLERWQRGFCPIDL